MQENGDVVSTPLWRTKNDYKYHMGKVLTLKPRRIWCMLTQTIINKLEELKGRKIGTTLVTLDHMLETYNDTIQVMP